MSTSSVQKYSYMCWSQPVVDNTPLTLKIWKLQDYKKGITSKEADEESKLRRRMLAFQQDNTTDFKMEKGIPYLDPERYKIFLDLNCFANS